MLAGPDNLANGIPANHFVTALGRSNILAYFVIHRVYRYRLDFDQQVTPGSNRLGQLDILQRLGIIDRQGGAPGRTVSVRARARARAPARTRDPFYEGGSILGNG